jgi:hypothetical protein
MKKILVVLLILSVAWGVFAQDGSWRLSGNVEVGTRLNFEPTPGDDNTDNDKATAGGATYNGWDTPRGRFALVYGTFVNDGALSVGLKFNTRSGGEENEPFFSYNGENFSFSTALFGNQLLVAGGHWDGGGAISSKYVKRLWGEYKFVNGLVTLHAAFKGEQTEYWISDTTAGSGKLATGFYNSDPGQGTEFAGGRLQSGRTNHTNFFGKPSTFTYTDSDGANYLLANLSLNSINFGLLIPNLLGSQNSNYYQTPNGEYMRTQGGELVEDVLKESVFGVKFSMAPIEFAGQFKLRDAGAYIGAKFFAGPLTVGASFSGILGPTEDDNGNANDKFIKIGGDLNFNGGVFAAGLAASYEKSSDFHDASIFDTLLRIQPRFSYNVIPSHLCFALDAGFYFLNRTNDDETLKDMVWAVQPQLFWTFLGTGARNGYGWAGPFYQGGPTGFIARYRVFSAPSVDFRGGEFQERNYLDVIFQFNF